MTFKKIWLGLMFLTITGSVLAEPDLCKLIDHSVKITQISVLNSDLVISVTPASLQKRRLGESDPVAAKKQLILAFNDYLRKKMSWNYLQIEARGQQLYIAKCYDLHIYVFKVPLENIKVTKLDKPKEGTTDLNLLDNFSSDDFSQDNSFGSFK
jgi:hypothetical protein